MVSSDKRLDDWFKETFIRQYEWWKQKVKEYPDNPETKKRYDEIKQFLYTHWLIEYKEEPVKKGDQFLFEF